MDEEMKQNWIKTFEESYPRWFLLSLGIVLLIGGIIRNFLWEIVVGALLLLVREIILVKWIQRGDKE